MITSHYSYKGIWLLHYSDHKYTRKEWNYFNMVSDLLSCVEKFSFHHFISNVEKFCILSLTNQVEI